MRANSDSIFTSSRCTTFTGTKSTKLVGKNMVRSLHHNLSITNTITYEMLIGTHEEQPTKRDVLPQKEKVRHANDGFLKVVFQHIWKGEVGCG